MPSSPHRIFLLSLVPLFALGCGGSIATGAKDNYVSPGPPPPPVDEAVACQLSTTDPETKFFLGLPPEESARLLTALQQGPVAVRAEGCKLTPVPACALTGSATYSPDPKEAPTEFANALALWRVMPFSAGRVAASSTGVYPLSVVVSIAGGFSYEKAEVAPSVLPSCKEATHLISAYSVGAFDIAPKGGESFLHEGDRKTCSSAAADPKGPPSACASLIAIKLLPLGPLQQEGAKLDQDKETDSVTKLETASTKGPRKPITAVMGGLKTRGTGTTSPVLATDVKSAEDFGSISGGEGATLDAVQLDTTKGRGSAKIGCDPADPLCMFGQ